MSAKPPRHLDAMAIQHEFFYAVALGVTAAASRTRTRTADMSMRSEGITLARFARYCGVFAPESEDSKDLSGERNPDDW
jgi:hypothetical protein